MKGLLGFISGLALSLLLTTILGAQTVIKKPSGKNQFANMPDNEMNQQLIKQLSDRIPETRNETIAWTGTDYGYVATFSVDNIEYMTVYDRSGNYVETFSKQAWDDRVPDVIKMEFDNSAYNTYTVHRFWEGIHTNNKHYYLEMLDKNGSSKNAWCDENGRFSDIPFLKN